MFKRFLLSEHVVHEIHDVTCVRRNVSVHQFTTIVPPHDIFDFIKESSCLLRHSFREAVDGFVFNRRLYFVFLFYFIFFVAGLLTTTRMGSCLLLSERSLYWLSTWLYNTTFSLSCKSSHSRMSRISSSSRQHTLPTGATAREGSCGWMFSKTLGSTSAISFVCSIVA